MMKLGVTGSLGNIAFMTVLAASSMPVSTRSLVVIRFFVVAIVESSPGDSIYRYALWQKGLFLSIKTQKINI
jgi:hypothetical protein